MSKWKALSYSDGKFTTTKFNEWAPSHPFTIPYQGAKIRYSEGDEITDITSPVFNIEFTGVPISNNHTPCGYWSKDYIPPQNVIYTSLLYPLEVTENAATVNIDLIEGIHKAPVIVYSIDVESIETSSITVLSGVFRCSAIYYDYIESLDTVSIDILSGVFKESLHNYTITNENLHTYSLNITSGIFKDPLIEYTFWTAESLETASINLTSGIYNVP